MLIQSVWSVAQSEMFCECLKKMFSNLNLFLNQNQLARAVILDLNKNKNNQSCFISRYLEKLFYKRHELSINVTDLSSQNMVLIYFHEVFQKLRHVHNFFLHAIESPLSCIKSTIPYQKWAHLKSCCFFLATLD